MNSNSNVGITKCVCILSNKPHSMDTSCRHKVMKYTVSTLYIRHHWLFQSKARSVAMCSTGDKATSGYLNNCNLFICSGVIYQEVTCRVNVTQRKVPTIVPSFTVQAGSNLGTCMTNTFTYARLSPVFWSHWAPPQPSGHARLLPMQLSQRGSALAIQTHFWVTTTLHFKVFSYF